MDSQEYDARFCSAELLVLDGDLQKVLDQSTSPKHKAGLQKRMAGALGSLNWLCRQYAAYHGIDPSNLSQDVAQLQTLFKNEDWKKSKQILSRLIEQMPLLTDGLKPEDANKHAVKTGKAVYESYCLSCHKVEMLNQERPAFSLFKLAKKLKQKEFIARMIVGVHGTPQIALQNPLTDDDIAGMYQFLLTAKE